jgi:hypothetical protein
MSSHALEMSTFSSQSRARSWGELTSNDPEISSAICFASRARPASEAQSNAVGSRDIDGTADVEGAEDAITVGERLGVEDVNAMGDGAGFNVGSVDPSSQSVLFVDFEDFEDFEALVDFEALDDFELHFVDFGAFEIFPPLPTLSWAIRMASIRGTMNGSSRDVVSTDGVNIPLSFLVVL